MIVRPAPPANDNSKALCDCGASEVACVERRYAEMTLEELGVCVAAGLIEKRGSAYVLTAAGKTLAFR